MNIYTNAKNCRAVEVALTSFGTIRNYASVKSNSSSVILAQSTRLVNSISSHNYIFKNIYRFALLKLFRLH